MERELHNTLRRRRDQQLAERRIHAREHHVDELLLLCGLHESGSPLRGGLTDRHALSALQPVLESAHDIISFSFFNASRTFCRTDLLVRKTHRVPLHDRRALLAGQRLHHVPQRVIFSVGAA